MRINQFLAAATPLSRRAADAAVQAAEVTVDGQPAAIGQTVGPESEIRYRGRVVRPAATQAVAFNKPAGAICSRRHQGDAPTIYDLLPPNLSDLQSVGRLDKDSSGLLILTNDGALHQRLGHPSHDKLKVYELELNLPISLAHLAQLDDGITLHDGASHLHVRRHAGKRLTVALKEGRNRQIRRTFEAIGYKVVKLHRTTFGPIELGDLPPGRWRTLSRGELS